MVTVVWERGGEERIGGERMEHEPEYLRSPGPPALPSSVLARRRFCVSDPLKACPGSVSSSIEARVPGFADGCRSSRPADPCSQPDNRWPVLPNGSKNECEGDSAIGLSIEAVIRRANEGVEEF